ncbi:MAG: pyrroline-5-carboxylate reductase [Spirochaetota bacterium]
MRIGFVGAGTMASALAAAISASQPDAEFTAYDISAERLARFRSALSHFLPADDNARVAATSDVMFLAVKPQIMAEILPDLADTDGLVVSVAAGVRIATLEDAMPRARVVRVMPNTPCLVGEMAAGYAGGGKTTPKDLETVERLLSSAGVAVELPEHLLDAVTGLSGSGPAFVARLVEAFTDAGEAEGLTRDVAYRLALATFSGTVHLLERKRLEPDELVSMVSSPGGTTVAGRRVLESSDYRDVIKRTVAAATERSKELGS